MSANDPKRTFLQLLGQQGKGKSVPFGRQVSKVIEKRLCFSIEACCHVSVLLLRARRN